ncbi:MAG: triose-phosphate isomerase, partial [Alphaproteobacteria bacterium]
WAIGTGRTPSAAEVAEAHHHIRAEIARIAAANLRLLYGGSVKPENAAELLSVDNVNGALIGGASLDAASFLAIALAAS